MKKKSSKLGEVKGLLSRRFASAVKSGVPPLSRQGALLREGIAILDGASAALAHSSLALTEQPFDRQLLALSPLYRRSRAMYLRGGTFTPAFVSSPRTLSSSILLEQRVEYSPVESELVWAASQKPLRKAHSRLLELRTYVSSLFHEQSHRILWRRLGPPPKDAAGLRRYLNLVESLVVILDMALGDELGPELAAVFYLGGAIYDPGTRVRLEGLTARQYRNYLQVALHATYLGLELYDPTDISEALLALFPMMPEALVRRAAERALRLDRGFVTRTNPEWQRRHGSRAARALARLSGAPVVLPHDPLDNRVQYLLAEEWLGLFGL